MLYLINSYEYLKRNRIQEIFTVRHTWQVNNRLKYQAIGENVNKITRQTINQFSTL